MESDDKPFANFRSVCHAAFRKDPYLNFKNFYIFHTFTMKRAAGKSAVLFVMHPKTRTRDGRTIDLTVLELTRE
jgi:hypothetical protein